MICRCANRTVSTIGAAPISAAADRLPQRQGQIVGAAQQRARQDVSQNSEARYRTTLARLSNSSVMDSGEIVQLTAADFEEGMALLNYAFSYSHGPHDFPSLLPKLYRPTDEDMGCNYAIRRDGLLAAAVGVFPMTWHVGGTALRVAGIGGVSTHPRYRGTGLMRVLMQHCVKEIRDAGYPLSYLDGLRRRYRHFGYEQCGTELLFTLGRDDLEAAGVDGSDIAVRRLTDGDPLLADAQRLHAAQLVRWERPPAQFVAICSSWNNQPYAAVTGSELAGYLIAGGDGSAVTELVAADVPTTLRIASAWCAHRDIASVTVAISPTHTTLVRRLDAIAESTTVRYCGHWQIFDWTAALSALLAERVRSGTAESGSLVMQIGEADRLELRVDGTETRVAPTDEPAAVTLDALTAPRALFGPLPPPWPTSWLPLPVHLPHADRV